MSIHSLFDSLGRDFRVAVRGLPRRPTFTLAAVLTLALGIGATTAIFSVVYSVLIKPLPYPNADELVRLRHPAPGVNVADMTSSGSMYFTYRDESRTFADVGLWQEGGQTLTGLGDPERVRSIRVTYGTLQALGVQPMRGRWFTEEEHGPAGDGPDPIIISHAFWQRRFGGDEAALGRDLTIDSRPAQVVGIMPPDFKFLNMTPQADVIVAVRLNRANESIGIFNFQALARLKPGVTAVDARADVERMLPIWLEAWPILPGFAVTREAIASWQIGADVRPLKDDLVGGVASALWVLMGAIAAVLLIACANIANLMLVRADARRQEFAVRSALGAVPARIARELLIESLVIGALGSALGLMLAFGALELLVAIGPSNLPRLEEIAIHPAVLAFTVAVSLASTLVFGAITAVKQALNIAATVGATRGASASRERSATRNALVVVQVALALVLVVSAVLMIRTFQALRDVDPGFVDPTTIQTARIWTPAGLLPDPARYTRMQHEMLDRIAGLPGVDSVAIGSTVPMEQLGGGGLVAVEGQVLAAGESPPVRRFKFVSPGYFDTMGTRVIAGRDVTWSDIEAGGRVALISEEFARELAPEPAGALGKRIRVSVEADAWREVIGVVQSVRELGLHETAPSLVYWPVLAESFFNRPVNGSPTVALVIRSERAGTASLMNEVRQAVWSVNADVPIALEVTMRELYADSLARTSFSLVMLAIAGAMASALGLIGIYGVIAYVVSQRTREIGIRLALGAQRRQVQGMFVRQGLALTGVGIVIGLVAAVALGRAMSSLLFGIDPMDPATYAAAVGFMLVAAALASYLPARRAAGIAPTETLRAE